jgi:hypothetical protein
LNINFAETFSRCFRIWHVRSGFQLHRRIGEAMSGDIIGLVAVIMIFGIPIAAMYTFYQVRKLRSEEHLAAIARGVTVPMQPELSESARSRRSGILLTTGALGYISAFWLIAKKREGSPHLS